VFDTVEIREKDRWDVWRSDVEEMFSMKLSKVGSR
jgi:hypothetical protein